MTFKNTKTILFASLLVAMILPFSGMMMAEAAPNENAIDVVNDTPKPKTTKINGEMLDISEAPVGSMPTPHTDGQLNGLKMRAIHDPKITTLLGDNYEFKSSGKYGSDKDARSQISFFTDDRQNVVTINFEHGKIIESEKYAVTEWGATSARGWAIDYYDGSQTLNGLQMRADTPSFSHSSGGFTAMLLNAQKSGTNTSHNICLPSNAPDDFWAQAGFQFNSSGTKVGWANTLGYCNPSFATQLTFATGDEVKFRIYIDDTEDEWFVSIDNLDDSTGAFVTDPIEVADSSTFDTGSRHTSVWYENANDDWNWDTGFSSDPDVNSAHYRKTTSSSWYYWDGETQIDYNCSGWFVDPEDLMSGTFVGSPHNVTFDVSTIEADCD